MVLEELSELKTGKEKEELIKEACKKFEKATELKPDMYDVFYNWGIVLRKLSELKTGKEKEQLEREAEEKFAKAKELQERTS